jgi:hypothetical protein
MLTVKMDEYRKNPLFISDLQRSINELPDDERQDVILFTCMNVDQEYRYLRFSVPRGESLHRNSSLMLRYILAMMNNMIVSFGGAYLTIYLDVEDFSLVEIVQKAIKEFDLTAPRNNRTGYGVYINYINRMNTFLDIGKFSIKIRKITEWSTPDPRKLFRVYKPENEALQVSLLNRSVQEMNNKIICSLDVGGNSIKGVVVANNEIIVTKEYRWYPTGLTTAQEMNEPQLLMIRFLSNYIAAKEDAYDLANDYQIQEAMNCNACYSCLEDAVKKLENIGYKPEGRFDAIVIGFPDIVVANKIAGGESFKHRGIKSNPSIDYETEFFKTSNLDDLVRSYAREGAPIVVLNDSNTASFLVSVQEAWRNGTLLDEQGMFANTVGTEMGTGFISRGGTIQYIPMEGFQHIIDLGNTNYASLPDEDLRSLRNMNTGIPGTIQKYISQLGLFRMTTAWFSERYPEVITQLIEKGLLKKDPETEVLTVMTDPISRRDTLTRILTDDMLKDKNNIVADAFKMMGKAMGILIDQDLLIFPEVSPKRLVSGGMVACDEAFKIMNDALKEYNPNYEMIRLDEQTSSIPLLQKIPSDKRSFTVAIGSVFIGNLFIIKQEG